MRSIRGKRALVTGAASGIGRAIALALAKEGADVCLVDINEAGLEEVAEAIENLGVRALPIGCDVSRSEEIAAAVDELLETWGGLEILVNNAGVLHYGPTHRMTDDQWERVLAVNLLAPIHFTRLLLRTLLRQPEAHIVNVSSMYGLFATRKTAAYHATKFGLVGLTESLRAEYGRQGIGVTTVCPGFVRSNLFEAGTSSSRNGEIRNPPAWACTTAENVARKTIRAIYRNRRLVLVTPLAYAGHYLKRIAPWLLDWIQHWGQAHHTHQRLHPQGSSSAEWEIPLTDDMSSREQHPDPPLDCPATYSRIPRATTSASK
jgi:NAD(P)-dependent dehydrogenase (short-subunit alcohol dehydrogenase family)